jgi:hypothetical protein
MVIMEILTATPSPSDIAVIMMVAIAFGYMLRGFLPSHKAKPSSGGCDTGGSCSTCGACARISEALKI